MESIQTPELARLLISAFVVMIAIGSVSIGFLAFLFNRMDKRFEVYQWSLIDRLEMYPTKEDFYELRLEMIEMREQIIKVQDVIVSKADENSNSKGD